MSLPIYLRPLGVAPVDEEAPFLIFCSHLTQVASVDETSWRLIL
jgi:hypothetical protein